MPCCPRRAKRTARPWEKLRLTLRFSGSVRDCNRIRRRFSAFFVANISLKPPVPPRARDGISIRGCAILDGSRSNSPVRAAPPSCRPLGPECWGGSPGSPQACRWLIKRHVPLISTRPMRRADGSTMTTIWDGALKSARRSGALHHARAFETGEWPRSARFCLLCGIIHHGRAPPRVWGAVGAQFVHARQCSAEQGGHGAFGHEAPGLHQLDQIDIAARLSRRD